MTGVVAKMHGAEIDIDLPLVARLVASQFPAWAELPLEPVEPAGTDNAIFRLGGTMAVRLPRIHWAIDQPAKEHECAGVTMRECRPFRGRSTYA